MNLPIWYKLCKNIFHIIYYLCTIGSFQKTSIPSPRKKLEVTPPPPPPPPPPPLPPPPPPPPSNVLIHLHYPVNCNNTGMLTADKHAHTCPKPRWHFSRCSASKKLTFRGLGRVSRSGKFSQKFVFERKSARNFFIKRLQL
jgi:hypothetical protein